MDVFRALQLRREARLLARARPQRAGLPHGHSRAGGGRWHYLLSRTGAVLKADRSFFTDAFVLTGLAELARIGSREDLPLIEMTFDQVVGNLQKKAWTNCITSRWNPRRQWHSVYMIGLFVCAVCAPLLGDSRTRAVADICLQKILRVFARDDLHVLLESVGHDGAVIDDAVGRRINPGHTMESMWFCMGEAIRRKDPDTVSRCVQVIDWAYEKGTDAEHGGLYDILDLTGRGPGGYDPARSFNEASDGGADGALRKPSTPCSSPRCIPGVRTCTRASCRCTIGASSTSTTRSTANGTRICTAMERRRSRTREPGSRPLSTSRATSCRSCCS